MTGSAGLAESQQQQPTPGEAEQPQEQPAEGPVDIEVEDSHNFASSKDGAKVVAANKEARKASALLDSDSDTFLKNECRADKWVIIELSQLAKVLVVELAQFELYSSRVKDFVVSAGLCSPDAVVPCLPCAGSEQKEYIPLTTTTQLDALWLPSICAWESCPALCNLEGVCGPGAWSAVPSTHRQPRVWLRAQQQQLEDAGQLLGQQGEGQPEVPDAAAQLGQVPAAAVPDPLRQRSRVRTERRAGVWQERGRGS